MTSRDSAFRFAITRNPFVGLIFCVCIGCPSRPSSTQGELPSHWIRVETADASHGNGLTTDDVEGLKATLPTIEFLLPERQGKGIAVRGDRTSEVHLFASPPESLQLLADTAGTTIAEGRFLTAEDSDQDADNVVLTQKLAATLFADEGAVGGTITIGMQQLVVVGVIRHSRDSVIFDATRGAYVAPASFNVASLQLIDHSGAELDRIWIKVRTLDDVPATKDVVANFLKRSHSESTFTIE